MGASPRLHRRMYQPHQMDACRARRGIDRSARWSCRVSWHETGSLWVRVAWTCLASGMQPSDARPLIRAGGTFAHQLDPNDFQLGSLRRRLPLRHSSTPRSLSRRLSLHRWRLWWHAEVEFSGGAPVGRNERTHLFHRAQGRTRRRSDRGKTGRGATARTSNDRMRITGAVFPARACVALKAVMRDCSRCSWTVATACGPYHRAATARSDALPIEPGVLRRWANDPPRNRRLPCG
jgi:hypothetical protein